MILNNVFEEESGGAEGCMGKRPGPLLYPAALLCVPFRKLRANSDAWRKGSQLEIVCGTKGCHPTHCESKEEA